MQILCCGQTDDKAVLQLNETDLQNIERARANASSRTNGDERLKKSLDDAAMALGRLNLHRERSRTYTGTMPIQVARNVIVLAACANACLSADDWSKLIE